LVIFLCFTKFDRCTRLFADSFFATSFAPHKTTTVLLC
jgi:hypothetical protein